VHDFLRSASIGVCSGRSHGSLVVASIIVDQAIAMQWFTHEVFLMLSLQGCILHMLIIDVYIVGQ
jgi:hypothetical protein